MKRRPVVVVLAAGRGQRFRGTGHKLEQRLGGGTLLSRTVAHALETKLRVVVVSSEKLAPMVSNLVAASDLIKVPELTSRGRPNPLGMGFSIAAGVAATGDAEGWLIVPGDMPLLQPATLLAVAEAIEQYPVAFAQYRGQRGHPVGFSAELYSELVALEGDEGARRLLARYPAQPVEVDDAGVLVDVDTVEDLARLRGEQARETLGSSR
ncbi:nucleotidyltransferase family protein [Pelomonas sp. SE-A7]|nr:nucleotidyltransferase family protein [Pelomonas sp. SE-A7]MDM4765121.1 nucleotidyltransferase family protein [Pelomonas sp. SE-A7]